jgi:hypothetical protein
MARASIAARVLLQGTLAALMPTLAPAHAGEGAASFAVSVKLQAGTAPDFGACKTGEVVRPDGISATVTCVPVPVPKDPGKPRVVSSVLFHISRGTWLGTADETMGLGTVTSWRVIRLANRDYLEMMVGW